jgi:hypothetical protein
VIINHAAMATATATASSKDMKQKNIFRKKDNPELFDKYLNTLNRSGRKLYIAKTRFCSELFKMLKIPELAGYLEKKLNNKS